MHYLNTILQTNIEFDQRSILITSSEIKNEILKYRNDNLIIDNLKIYTENEFIKAHIFDIELDKVNELVKVHGLKLNAAKDVVTAIAITNHLGIEISELPNEMNSNEIQLNLNLPSGYKLYTYSVLQSDFFELISNEVIEVVPNTNCNESTIYCFEHYLNEIEDSMEYIYGLLASGISENQIHVYMPSNYNALFSQVASNYKIPIANSQQVGFKQTAKGLEVINKFKETGEIELTGEDFCDEIIIKCVNEIKLYSDDLQLYKEVLLELLSQSKITKETRSGLNIKNKIDTWFTNEQFKNDYIICLGNYQDGLITYQKDDRIISNHLRNTCVLKNSNQINEQLNLNYLKIINGFSNKYISYSSRILDSMVEIANNIKSLNKVDSIVQYNFVSSLNDRLSYARALATYEMYGIENEVHKLFSSKINLEKYDNSYKKIGNSIDPMQLSYTSINNFYKCQYRFYLEHVLRIKNGKFDSNRVFIGNLIHHVLEVIDFSKIPDSEQILLIIKNYINTNDMQLNNVDTLYLSSFASYLEDICRLICEDDMELGYTKLEREKEYELNLKNEFKLVGKIDKILSKIDGENLVCEIVDYKTGSLNINFDHIDFGLDMQNLIYYLMIKKELINEDGDVVMRGTFQHQIKPSLLFDGQTNADTTKLKGYAQFKNDSVIKRTQKIVSFDEITKLTDVVESKIANVVDKTIARDFPINPKRIDGKDVSCSYCKYEQICNKTYKDNVYLSKGK